MSKRQRKGKKVKKQRVRLRGNASEEAALRIEASARGQRSGRIDLPRGEPPIDAPAGSELVAYIESREVLRQPRVESEIRGRVLGSGDDEPHEHVYEYD